jgi:hypothetical protein
MMEETGDRFIVGHVAPGIVQISQAHLSGANERTIVAAQAGNVKGMNELANRRKSSQSKCFASMEDNLGPSTIKSGELPGEE